MAKYFSLSYSNFGTEFEAALEEYYGDGVTIESATSTACLFACPAISDKSLKIEVFNSGVRAYVVADGHQRFANVYTNGTTVGYHLILSDAFILVDSMSTTDYRNSVLAARLTNGRPIVTAGCISTNANYLAGNHHCFTDTMEWCTIRMFTPYPQNARSNGKLCLLPSFLSADLEMVLNADGTFASIPGLWLASSTGSPVAGSNYYLSQSGLSGNSPDGICCYTQKYVELSGANAYYMPDSHAALDVPILFDGPGEEVI